MAIFEGSGGLNQEEEYQQLSRKPGSNHHTEEVCEDKPGIEHRGIRKCHKPL